LFSQVLAGEGNSFAHVALERAQSARTTAIPSRGRMSQSSLRVGLFINASAFHVVDREALCVFLRLRWVKSNVVEERFGVIVRSGVLVADLFHGLLVDVWAHDAFCDAGIIRRAGHHSPPPKLREPPDRVFGLGVVAVAFAVNHVVLVFGLAAVAKVVVAEQTGEDRFFRAVDVSGTRYDLSLLR